MVTFKTGGTSFDKKTIEAVFKLLHGILKKMWLLLFDGKDKIHK